MPGAALNRKTREGRRGEIGINFNCSCAKTASLSPCYTVCIYPPAQAGHVSKACVREDCFHVGLLQEESFGETVHITRHPRAALDQGRFILVQEGAREEEILYLGTKQWTLATCIS